MSKEDPIEKVAEAIRNEALKDPIEMVAEATRIAKVRKAILKGNIEFDPRCEEAIKNFSLKNPDFTLTEVVIDSTWGAWERMSKDGKTKRGNKGGFSINWMTKSAGCGRIEIFTDNDGKLRIETQAMNREFCKEVICKLIDQAEERED